MEDLRQARQMALDALVIDDPVERVRMAKEALALSELCADAYVILAIDEAGSLQDAQNLYERGLRAAERAVGEAVLEEMAGSLWELEEARPYMRARMGLTVVLWALGEKGGAIAHAREMLRLNVPDEQGVRFFLFCWLVLKGHTTDAGTLLQRYADDPTPQWAYARLLLLISDGTQTGEAVEAAFGDALQKNSLVPAYLLWQAPPARARPENPFDRTVAAATAAECTEVMREAWEASPEALACLRGLWRQLAPRSCDEGEYYPG